MMHDITPLLAFCVGSFPNYPRLEREIAEAKHRAFNAKPDPDHPDVFCRRAEAIFREQVSSTGEVVGLMVDWVADPFHANTNIYYPVHQDMKARRDAAGLKGPWFTLSMGKMSAEGLTYIMEDGIEPDGLIVAHVPHDWIAVSMFDWWKKKREAGGFVFVKQHPYPTYHALREVVDDQG